MKRRLVLRRETIRVLADLTAIAGGQATVSDPSRNTAPSCESVACPTQGGITCASYLPSCPTQPGMCA